MAYLYFCELELHPKEPLHRGRSLNDEERKALTDSGYMMAVAPYKYEWCKVTADQIRSAVAYNVDGDDLGLIIKLAEVFLYPDWANERWIPSDGSRMYGVGPV